MSDVKTTTSLFDRICDLLKSDDSSNVKALLSRAERDLTRAVKANEQNIRSLQEQLEVVTTKHQDRVEDLQQALKDSYTNVNADRIKTNADREAFLPVWLGGISNAEAALEAEEKRYETEAKAYTDRIAEHEKQVAALNTRITNLKG